MIFQNKTNMFFIKENKILQRNIEKLRSAEEHLILSK